MERNKRTPGLELDLCQPEHRAVSAVLRAVSTHVLSRQSDWSLSCPPLDTSASAAAAGSGMWSAVKRPLPISLTDYEAPVRDVASLYLGYNILRKCDGLVGVSDVDRENNAISSFWASEKRCSTLNNSDIWRSSRNFAVDTAVEVTVPAVLHSAARLISECLGKFDWNKVVGDMGFSGGATTRLPRRMSSPPNKIRGKPDVTRNCALLALTLIHSTPRWADECRRVHGRDSDPFSWVNVVPGARLTTVGKDSFTDRTIAIEPELNMLFQKGIGSRIRRALLRKGINLNDQTVNQRLALIGSRTGALCTIDLKAASDSVSLRLCEELLPPDWYYALCMTRSEAVEQEDLKGRFFKLHKISSMGNGYTFELESLIFWAITRAVCELTGSSDRRIGVYGDDIVCHNSYAKTLCGVLSAVGFETNTDKSFITGPFRESCGKHYFLGVDVTPFNVKTLTSSKRETTVHHLHNSYAAWLARVHGNTIPKDQGQVLRYLRRLVPEELRIFVPSSYGLRAGFHTSRPFRGCRWIKRKAVYEVVSLRYSQESREINTSCGLIAALLRGSNPTDVTVDASNRAVMFKCTRFLGARKRHNHGYTAAIGETVMRLSKSYIGWWD